MTVKMNDGNFYNGVSSEITFSFNNPAGLLGIDASPLSDRAPDTWYYIYAVPSGGNFSIVASTRSPIAAMPDGYTYYKYLGAFLTDSSSNIYSFTHIYPSKFMFSLRISTSTISYGANLDTQLTLILVPENCSCCYNQP